MSSVVLDASAAVDLLLRKPNARTVQDALRGFQVAVPAHFDAEVFSALGRLVRNRDIGENSVEPILVELARAPFARLALEPLLAAAWDLRHNLSLRDALYVALAQRLGASLVTTDARLSRAPALPIPVILAVDLA